MSGNIFLYYRQGSNGEVAYLSEEERVAIVRAVRSAVPKDTGKLIIAGKIETYINDSVKICNAL